MNTIAKYASLVKLSHTIFALPFALIGYVYAFKSNSIEFEWLLLLQILICMVTARNTAMAFNRWIDREIDAKNPRTANREIPVNKISPANALTFTIVNGFLFVATAIWINPLAGWLSPVALLIIVGYSYTKLYTAWSHIVLGVALAIAPAGAYIAVMGGIDWNFLVVVILSGAVLTWTAGFDILYSMQDARFDKEHSLHSIPARFSPAWSVAISIILHIVTIYAVVLFGTITRGGDIYWVGVGIFVVLLVLQHIIYTPKRVDRIGRSFGLVNGSASLIYAVFTIADMLV